MTYRQALAVLGLLAVVAAGAALVAEAYLGLIGWRPDYGSLADRCTWSVAARWCFWAALWYVPACLASTVAMVGSGWFLARASEEIYAPTRSGLSGRRRTRTLMRQLSRMAAFMAMSLPKYAVFLFVMLFVASGRDGAFFPVFVLVIGIANGARFSELLADGYVRLRDNAYFEHHEALLGLTRTHILRRLLFRLEFVPEVVRQSVVLWIEVVAAEIVITYFGNDMAKAGMSDTILSGQDVLTFGRLLVAFRNDPWSANLVVLGGICGLMAAVHLFTTTMAQRHSASALTSGDRARGPERRPA